MLRAARALRDAPPADRAEVLRHRLHPPQNFGWLRLGCRGALVGHNRRHERVDVAASFGLIDPPATAAVASNARRDMLVQPRVVRMVYPPLDDRLVEGLRRRNHPVVALTEDGALQAPLLEAAHDHRRAPVVVNDLPYPVAL